MGSGWNEESLVLYVIRGKQGGTSGGIVLKLSTGQFSVHKHMKNSWEGLHQGQDLLG